MTHTRWSSVLGVAALLLLGIMVVKHQHRGQCTVRALSYLNMPPRVGIPHFHSQANVARNVSEYVMPMWFHGECFVPVRFHR